MDYMNYAACAIAAWNITVFAIYGIDKYRAKKNRWRISEQTLILLALLMGGFGALVGMRWFRHKTKNMKFKILIPLSVLINCAAIIVLVYVNNKK